MMRSRRVSSGSRSAWVVVTRFSCSDRAEAFQNRTVCVDKSPLAAKQWVDAQDDPFCPLDASIQQGDRQILQLYPNDLRQGARRSTAGPFVITLAMVNNGTVVTEESASISMSRTSS